MAHTLGDFEQRILFALIRLGVDAYGVTIRQEIETRTGRAISAGALYTALARLEKRGLVTSRLGESDTRARWQTQTPLQHSARGGARRRPGCTSRFA